jgi:hypothetical protein
MTVKQQLQAYYAKQGLTGKHLRKALQWDMKAVSRNKKASHYPPEWERDPRRAGLIHAFGWSSTPEGIGYWVQRSLSTGK